LFELVFAREEAKDGSVEGKGEKLSLLDPNQRAAIQEETERRSAKHKSYVWPEIKKAIDEKCRMVRNNRCFVWAGVNVNVKTDIRTLYSIFWSLSPLAGYTYFQ